MKRNKILIGLVLLAQCIGFTSCNDWLELLPEDSVPKQNYWKTKEDVASAMTGVYCSLLNSGLSKNLILWGEIRADMLSEGVLIPTDWYMIRRGEIAATNGFSSYGAFYGTINNCNLLLENAPRAQAIDESFTVKALQEYQAQAIAVRSLLYFYLVRTFRDIPFPLEAYSDNSQYLPIVKTLGEEVLDVLVSDLEYILDENWIPVRYSNTDDAQNKGYMTRYAVNALLADIYLWKEDYQSCVNICDEILNSGQFALIPVQKMEIETDEGDTIYAASPSSIGEYFRQVYVDGNSIESIFELQFDKDIYNPFYNYFVAQKRYMLPNTENLIENIFPSTEKAGLRSTFVDMRSSISSKMGYVWKWAGKTYDGTEIYSSEEMTANLIIYRLPQIYLMKAEALTQLAMQNGDDQEMYNEALDLVMEIRKRAGAVETTDMDIPYDGNIDGKSLEEFILAENAREFMYEGKRWFDLLRNAKRNDYKSINYLMNIIPYSTITDKVYSVRVKMRDRNSHYLPLPKDDLERNPLLVQNPFYETK